MEDPYQSFPAVRKWHKGATASEFKRIVSATEIYRTERPISSGYGTALHTVTICDLARGAGTGILRLTGIGLRVGE
jgi:hypothetical protein